MFRHSDSRQLAHLAQDERQVLLVAWHGQQQVCRQDGQESEARPLQALVSLPCPFPHVLGSYGLQARRCSMPVLLSLLQSACSRLTPDMAQGHR